MSGVARGCLGLTDACHLRVGEHDGGGHGSIVIAQVVVVERVLGGALRA
jgi:hypothetical protein